MNGEAQMKLFANEKTKRLWRGMVLLLILFNGISVGCLILKPKQMAFYIWISSFIMAILMLGWVFLYIQDQHRILETATRRIRAYFLGDETSRIECDEEGEIYRLFYEVNLLVSALNAQAKNEEKSKVFMRETISNISHQLKTPLAALHIYNGILLEEGEQVPTVKEFTKLSEQELDHMNTLILNLLNLTKFEAQTVRLEQAEESVADMMAQIERQFTYRARQEGKKIVLSGDDSVMLCCDRLWVMEAVSNLIKNALDHTTTGEMIQIKWCQFATVVQLVVEDNGAGIHPEDLPHIFKRFYRSRFSKQTSGIGLGLPLVKMIVEASHGTIEVDSELDLGTRFTLNFLIPTKL